MGADDPTLFDVGGLTTTEPEADLVPLVPQGRVVRVQPDEVAVDKAFDYVVPDKIAEQVVDGIAVGDRVRIDLGPRRVAGWIVALDVTPASAGRLRAISKWSGRGPGADVVDLARWARRHWVARSIVPFLRAASPARNVERLPTPMSVRPPASGVSDPVLDAAFATDPRGRPAVLRLPPTEDRLPVVLAAAARGDALVIAPSRAEARSLATRARRSGVEVALHPEDWARATAGRCTVIGSRAAAWAPIPAPASIVVLDEHDEAHQEEASPTWHARDVAVERARRAGIPCVLVSPIPSLQSLHIGRLITTDRSRERSAWPAVIVADRREDDAARNALFAPALVDIVRTGVRVVGVLNTKGRAALLACRRCRELIRCEHCNGPVHRPGGGRRNSADEGDSATALVCRRCDRSRPEICDACGSLDLSTVRMGVQRIAEDLAAMAGESVVTVTAETPVGDLATSRLFVGTEAALHRIDRADVVAFLDFDRELLAPRQRAVEQALALLVRGARMVGGRKSSDGPPGRLLIQTRQVDHPVIIAAVLGDPARVSDVVRADRELFGFPPFGALAEVGGAAASAFVSRIPARDGVRVLGPIGTTWQVRAPDHDTLVEVLDAVERPPGRLRLAIDPPRS